MPKINTLHDLESLRKKITSARNTQRPCITVCAGTGCLAYGAQDIYLAFEREIARQSLQDKVDLRRTGCHGFCGRGPVIVILPEKTCYLGATEKDVPQILSQTLIEKKFVESLLYKDFTTGQTIKHIDEIPFYKYQKRILLENNTLINPKNIEDYLALGGYAALAKVLTQARPDDIIQEIKKANLRGRGGGGVPAGA